MYLFFVSVILCSCMLSENSKNHKKNKAHALVSFLYFCGSQIWKVTQYTAMEQHSFFIFCAFRYHLLPTTYEIADDVATTDKVSITWTNYQLTNIISFLMLRTPVTKNYNYTNWKHFNQSIASLAVTLRRAQSFPKSLKTN